jgi:hypothetical protein
VGFWPQTIDFYSKTPQKHPKMAIYCITIIHFSPQNALEKIHYSELKFCKFSPNYCNTIINFAYFLYYNKSKMAKNRFFVIQ